VIRAAYAQTKPLSDIYLPGMTKPENIGALLSPLINNAIILTALASFAAVSAFVITQIIGRIGGFDFLKPGI